MNTIEEKRDAMRIGVKCEIYCKVVGSDQAYPALCVTLSNSGVSLISEQCFNIGSTVEVCIPSEIESMAPLCFLIIIVRCNVLEKGGFEMGAIIVHQAN